MAGAHARPASIAAVPKQPIHPYFVISYFPCAVGFSAALFCGDAWDSISRKFLETAPPPNDVARLQTSSDNDNSSDHNDIRADFGATWQIRYTTIHGRLRTSGRLYELRAFAMRACVVDAIAKTPSCAISSREAEAYQRRVRFRFG
jgi:hypothetical protein